jgi:hypothetical protein
MFRFLRRAHIFLVVCLVLALIITVTNNANHLMPRVESAACRCPLDTQKTSIKAA